jgi:hypothetical protein
VLGGDESPGPQSAARKLNVGGPVGEKSERVGLDRVAGLGVEFCKAPRWVANPRSSGRLVGEEETGFKSWGIAVRLCRCASPSWTSTMSTISGGMRRKDEVDRGLDAI